MWFSKYATAVFNASNCKSLLQHGANNVETLHANILKKFKYLKATQVHLPFVPVYQCIIKNNMNSSATNSLINDQKNKSIQIYKL